MTKTNMAKKSDLLKEQLARSLADYDNLKRRVESERELVDQKAKVRIINRLLPVFDMLFEVQAHLNDAGLALTIKELKDILKEEGIAEIEVKKGDKFDENLHEATEVVPDEKNKGKILKVVLTGWKLTNGFVIRHTKVVVNN